MSTVKSEESVNEEGNETEESEARQRKKSLLQRFVTAIFANEDDSNRARSSGEKTLPEVREEGYSDRPAGNLFCDCCSIRMCRHLQQHLYESRFVTSKTLVALLIRSFALTHSSAFVEALTRSV